MLPDFVELDDEPLISRHLAELLGALQLSPEADEGHLSVSDTLRRGELVQHLPRLRNRYNL